ncbi:MAG: hypothetical protein WCQ55_04635 [Paludibacteraceae bacterium]
MQIWREMVYVSNLFGIGRRKFAFGRGGGVASLYLGQQTVAQAILLTFLVGEK